MDNARLGVRKNLLDKRISFLYFQGVIRDEIQEKGFSAI